MAEERVADGTGERNGGAVQLFVEQGQFGIDGGPGLAELIAFAIDAEGNALGGDDVEDRFGQFVAGKAAADGVFDRGVVEGSGDVVLGRRVDGADVVRGNGAFAGVVAADGGGDGGLFVDDDQYLGGRLGAGGQGERGDGRQE
jgi:hypothetical protein